MSRYGPPGGPDPAGYDPPSDPWGGAGGWPDPSGGYGSPYPAHPYPAQDLPPPPPPTRRHGGALVALMVMLLVLAAAGVATTLYLVSGESTPVAAESPEPSGAAGALVPTTDPPASGSTPDNLGLAAGLARVGDCLVNDGTAETPQLRITLCDAAESATVYRVLARFDRAVADDNGARAVCGGTEGYQVHYYFISEAAGESYVLCLAEAV